MDITDLKLKDYSWYDKWYFPSGEMGIELKEDIVGTFECSTSLNKYHIRLTAEITSPDDIFELLLVTNVLKKWCVITLFLPYIPFGRQDRHTTEGSPFSLKVFANLINAQGYHKVTTRTPHSNVSELLIDNLAVIEDDLNYVGVTHALLEKEDTVFIAPDAGAYKRVLKLAEIYEIPNISVGNKRRNPSTGEILGMEVSHIPENKHLVVIDDICDGGRTFIELAKVLPEKRKSLTLYVTHGIFSKGRDVLCEAGYDNIVCASNFIEERGRRRPLKDGTSD